MFCNRYLFYCSYATLHYNKCHNVIEETSPTLLNFEKRARLYDVDAPMKKLITHPIIPHFRVQLSAQQLCDWSFSMSEGLLKCVRFKQFLYEMSTNLYPICPNFLIRLRDRVRFFLRFQRFATNNSFISLFRPEIAMTSAYLGSTLLLPATISRAGCRYFY